MRPSLRSPFCRVVLGVALATATTLLMTLLMPQRAAAADGELAVTVVPWGPSPEVVEAARNGVLSQPEIQRFVGRADVAMISFTLVDPPQTAGQPAQPPTHYRAELFDYTRNRAYVVEGPLQGRSRPTIAASERQPEPDDAERARALAIVETDRELGAALSTGQLIPYPPMPPLVDGHRPVGEVHRTVTIGLAPQVPAARHEIVGVDMIGRRLIRYPALSAPPSSRAVEGVCGSTNANQPTTSMGTAGQMTVTITKEGSPIWSFLAVRPAASSGTRKSGLELRDVFYKGKKVLARAHAPILNVHYENDACGPYRDWQWQEGQFVAHGRDVPGMTTCTTSGCSGVRAARSAPESIVDDGHDNGNFRGIAYYIDGQSVTLVSEMQAGWYRYISYWILDSDGSIHPRFGFGGVSNSCICNVHFHNVYWRFDFDLVTASNNQLYQVNGGTPTLQTVEARQNNAAGRSWQVENSSSGETYAILPAVGDSPADAYAKGDVWLLVGKGAAELDDGVNCTQGCDTSIQIDNFLGESFTAASDVVFWYGSHFIHDVTHQEGYGRITGPDLIPIVW